MHTWSKSWVVEFRKYSPPQKISIIGESICVPERFLGGHHSITSRVGDDCALWVGIPTIPQSESSGVLVRRTSGLREGVRDLRLPPIC